MANAGEQVITTCSKSLIFSWSICFFRVLACCLAQISSSVDASYDLVSSSVAKPCSPLGGRYMLKIQNLSLILMYLYQYVRCRAQSHSTDYHIKKNIYILNTIEECSIPYFIIADAKKNTHKSLYLIFGSFLEA